MQLFAPSAPAEKADFWFWAPKNGGFSECLKKKNAKKYFWGPKYFWGVEKVIWPPNTITRRRRKKKKTRFFRLGAEKYCSLGAHRKSRFLVLGAEKKISRRKKKFGGRNCFGGERKNYLAAEHHNEAAPKKKNPLGRRKIRL